MTARYRTFLLLFITPILLLLPAGIANWRFLYEAGELMDIPTIVATQQREGGLYGSALHPNDYLYKLELVAARKPSIVVIGSSRVLQFRQSMFMRPFVNLGRTINYPAESVKLVEDLLAAAKPDMVLFGIDHYWLNPAYTTAPDFRHHEIRGGDLSPDALITPFRWLTEDRLDIATYLDFLAGGVGRTADGKPLIGARAILDGSGFGADGSWYYDHIIYGRRPAEDPGFRDTLRRISTGTAQFRRGSAIDPARLADLAQAIALLRGAGVSVVTFIPPMATPVLAAMADPVGTFAYADAARRAIAGIGVPHADFLDGAAIGASDCEFIDGFHGGEVVAARMLRALADTQGTGLAPFLEAAAIDKFISDDAGFAIADTQFRRGAEVEIDFLEIGCPKPARIDRPTR